MRAAAVILALVSSAFAYSVITPTTSEGWTNQGAQPLTWQRVDTDRLNFTALLTNQQIPGFQPQILAAQVDGTLGKTNLNPPSGGWPIGSGFRLNLVQDDNDLNTILTQSLTFSITQSTSTLSVSTTGTTAGTTGVTVATTAAGTDTDASATNTDPIVLPTTSGAAAGLPLNVGLLGIFSLVALVLA